MTLPIMQQAMIERALRFGAIGIGEDHTKPDARNLVIALIDAGLVRNLLLERAPLYQKRIDVAVDSGVRTVLALRSKLFFEETYQCDTDTADVVAHAIARGVDVHCVDDRIAMNPRRSSSSSGMKTRNEHVAKKFFEICDVENAREAGASGCLILFGGAHFEKKHSIVELIPGLQWFKAG